MPTRYLLAGAIFSGAIALIGPASAQTTPLTPVTTPVNPGFFYWSLGASSGVKHLPNWRYGQTAEFGFNVANYLDAYSYDPKPWGAGPEFVMGYALNRASPLGRVGDKPRIELGLSTFFGKTTDSSIVGGGYAMLVLPSVDGSLGLLALNDGTNAKLETTVYSGEAALRFKTEFGTRRLKIVPSVAAIGGMDFYRYRWQTNYSYDIFLHGQVFAHARDVVDVKETIRGWHAGGEFALQGHFAINSRFSIHGGAAIAVMMRRSSLSAYSHLSGFSAAQGPVDAQANASDNSTEFAWRLGLNFGITYNWGWGRVTVTGFGYWDSAVPQIDNPRFNSTTPGGNPARLTSSGEWAYGGRVAIVFPLYRQRY